MNAEEEGRWKEKAKDEYEVRGYVNEARNRSASERYGPCWQPQRAALAQ